MPSPKMIVLKSSDGETFEMEQAVAVQSHTIKNMIEDNCADASIPVPNVSSNILAKVIEYCKKHVEVMNSEPSKEDLEKFDTEFVEVDQATLFELVLAANYLDIKGLLDLTCQAAANMIKDMNVEEVREIFNIKNDFAPEEEEEIRKQYAWAFE